MRAALSGIVKSGLYAILAVTTACVASAAVFGLFFLGRYLWYASPWWLVVIEAIITAFIAGALVGVYEWWGGG